MILLFFITALAIFAWVIVIKIDVEHFEIEPLALLAALLLSALPIYLRDPSLGQFFDMAVAGAIGLGAGYLIHRFSPTKLGRGDIALIGAFWAIAGLEWFAIANVMLLITATITALSYSYARRKKPFRSLFPLALPVGVSAIALLIFNGIVIIGGFDV